MSVALVLAAVATFLIYAIFYTKSDKKFWEKYGVPHLHHATVKENLDIFMGKKIFPDFDENLYKSLSEDEKFCGFTQLGENFFLPKDLDLIKKILIKEFDHFVDRRGFAKTKSQPIMGKMLANLRGEEWKCMRSVLTSTFATGKIRRMMEYFNSVSIDWVNHFEEEIRRSGGKSAVIKVNNETTRYTVDVIASGTMAQQLIDFNLWIMLKLGLSVAFPRLINVLNVKVIDHKSLTFFADLLARQLKERKESNEKRNDFLQLILEAQKCDELDMFEKEAILQDSFKGNKNLLKDEETAIAQMMGFFFAGLSTTSNFIGTVMYTLAMNQDVQYKLRHEINNSSLFKDGGNDIDYDELNKLVYLEMVLCEILRWYPAFARIERICVKDYHDPEYGFTIPKGAIVAIPVQAIHNDPKYYEHPNKFFPEHFTPEKKAERSLACWLPFGQGPRNCIGMRFALVQSKAAILRLLKNYKIEPCEKTPIPQHQNMKPAQISFQTPDNLELKLRCIE